jgi:hypothetical protein
LRLASFPIVAYPGWLIRFLGGDYAKKRGGSLARGALLCQGVLPSLNHFLRDLLAQLNGVEWLMLGEPAQNC